MTFAMVDGPIELTMDPPRPYALRGRKDASCPSYGLQAGIRTARNGRAPDAHVRWRSCDEEESQEMQGVVHRWLPISVDVEKHNGARRCGAG